jgi:uncharacterized protein
MIKIKIARDEHGISLISMHGHAEYDQYGKDIVCSAASTIIIGGINAIAQLGYLSFISYKVDAGDVELKINNTECGFSYTWKSNQSNIGKYSKFYNTIKFFTQYTLFCIFWCCIMT